MNYISFKIKVIYYLILITFLTSCIKKDEEIKVYIPVDTKAPLPKIFNINNKFVFLNLRDSTEILKSKQNSNIIAYNNIELKELVNLKEYNFTRIEGSNHQGGRFDLDYNFNFDFKLEDNFIFFNINYPKAYSNSYKIKLNVQEINLLKKGLFNFENIKTIKSNDLSYTISILFIDKDKRNVFTQKIDNESVSLFYDSLRLILIQHLLKSNEYEILKNRVDISTSKIYYGLRNPPL